MAETPYVGAPTPEVVAHRGDSLRYRENTLAAVGSAVAQGADRVEIDVVTTADGHSVVNHDQTLLRLWGVPRRVRDMTWDEVAAVGYADVRIPRLVDVAEVLRGTGVTLLVDATTAPDAAAAWRALDHWRRGSGPAGADLTVHWCGAPAATGAVRELDPAAILHLESTTGRVEEDLLAAQRPTYLNLEGTLLSPTVVTQAHAAGLAVAVWTVDDPAAMAAMLGLGADAITTNRPGLLRRLLDEGALTAAAARWADPSTPVARAWAAPTATTPMTPPTPTASAGVASRPSEAELARAAAVAGELAGWACGYLRESRPVAITTKAHAADLVTEVDRAVERRVREVLAAEFPGHLIVGEEEGGTSAAGVPVWYLDPVDGTTNYAHGLGWSSFSLALAVDQTPLVAVVADPWRGEVLAARAGHGATLNGLPLHLPDPGPRPPEAPLGGTVRGPLGGTLGGTLGGSLGGGLAGTVVLTEWAAHVPFRGQVDLLAALAEHHVTTRVMGSGTLSTASVAAGRAAGCVIGDFHPEDHLAATLIAREAGARCLDVDGREVAWPRGAFLVAAPASADALGALLTRCCR